MPLHDNPRVTIEQKRELLRELRERLTKFEWHLGPTLDLRYPPRRITDDEIDAIYLNLVAFPSPPRPVRDPAPWQKDGGDAPRTE